MTVIVTGGARGIGKGIVRHLLQKKHAVAIFDILESEGEAAVREFSKLGQVRFYKVDVSNESQVKKSVSQVVKDFGKIHGLVNNAALANPEGAPLEKLDFEVWRKVFSVAVDGSFFCMKHVLPQLKKKGGSIVNVTSTRAYMAEPNTEAYCATKGAMLSLTRAAAISCGPHVRVNAVNPGWIDTSEESPKKKKQKQKISKKAHAQHPVGRVGVPQDIAALVEFLISDAAANITGTDITSDGGMTRKMIYEN